MEFIDTFFEFFIENFPSIKQIIIFSPLFLLLVSIELYLIGSYKKKHGTQTGLTRKTFHFITFFSVSFLQYFYGLPLMCLYGACCCLVIFIVIYLGNGNTMYEVMAREKDSPHRTLFIILPLISTFLGGVFSNILYPTIAFCGYLVAGIGDAVGEVFGSIYGKHKYKPLKIIGIQKYKSFEGSLAIFIFSLLVLICVMILMGLLSTQIFFICIVIALISTIIEAISPPGTDNFFMQLIPNALVFLLIMQSG
jgi:phytol kinase